MKASAITHPNIAFVKYWGKKDVENSIPTRDNCSMTLSDLITHTTVEFSKEYSADIVILNGVEQTGKQYGEVVRQLDRMRKYKSTKERAKVVSVNNFPTAAGIASSAAGFSALTVACNEALELRLDERELSR
ncbi:MAG: diphosphomevalonate decarboxylase, partial [archaeon]